jgi:hypothetical protein
MKSTGKYGGEIPDLFLGLVDQILKHGSYETEAIVRTLVALGTVLLTDGVFVEKAKVLIGSSIQSLACQHGEKAAAVGSEIQSILG